MSNNEVDKLALPKKRMQSIHPFLHHWLTSKSSSKDGNNRTHLEIKAASMEANNFATQNFPDKRYTVLTDDIIEEIQCFSESNPVDFHDFRWQDGSSSLNEKVLVPKPLPKFIRQVFETKL